MDVSVPKQPYDPHKNRAKGNNAFGIAKFHLGQAIENRMDS